MAEAAALEAPVCAGAHDCDARARIAARRLISFRHRHSGLCCLDARALDTSAKFRLDRGTRRRLARTVGRISRHPLRDEGKTRGTNAVLPRISPPKPNLRRIDLSTIRLKADFGGTNLNSRIASALRDELLSSLAQLPCLWVIGNPPAPPAQRERRGTK